MAAEIQLASFANTGVPRSIAAGGSVCLITPPSSFLLDERVFVSLGILKVASSLEARGITVNFLDLSGVDNYLMAIADYLTTASDIAIRITTTTPQLPAVMKIAEVIGQNVPISGSSSVGLM